MAAAVLVVSSIASSLGGCANAGSLEGADASDGGIGGVGGGTGGSFGGGGSGGSGGTGLTDPSITFDPPGPLSLLRGEARTLEVATTPAGLYLVRFALLPGPEGTLPGDAALSATDVLTNTQGRAPVTLTAPSAPATFQVRASRDDGLTTTLLVNVEKTGRADLRVDPIYSGDREVTSWLAMATPGKSCAMLSGDPLDDTLDWTESTEDFVELRDLKADTQLAVVVRAERFAWGCVTVPAVVEGMDNRVQIPVANVPVKLTGSTLTTSLDLSMFQGSFQAGMEPSILAALAGVPGGGDDVKGLLDRMQSQSDEDAASFQAARATGGWDVALATLLGTGAATSLRGPLERWMRAGLANTSAGRFVGTLSAKKNDAEGATLTLQTVAGLPPAELGVSAMNDATWYSSSPADDVFIGTTLSLDPSQLVFGGALAPARTEVDGSDTVAGALAALLPCDGVAAELVAHGAAAQVAFAGCSQSCARKLCEDALASVVTELAEREESEGSSLELAAAAAATVGSDAELVGLDGTWVGSLVNEGETADVGGTLVAPAP